MTNEMIQHDNEGVAHQIIFIHIPKCAGVSMAKAISGQVEVHRVGPHAKYQDIFHLQERFVRDQSFVFSFVRNPWDRLVSTFFYMMQGGRADIDKQRRDKYLLKYKGDFKCFVRDIENWFFIQEDTSIYPDKYIPHFRPQYEFVSDKQGNVAVDFIGRVESIDSDFGKLCKALSLEGVHLPKSNTSSHRKFYKYYDDETRDIVAEYYAKDIELFEYQFSPDTSGLTSIKEKISQIRRIWCR